MLLARCPVQITEIPLKLIFKNYTRETEFSTKQCILNKDILPTVLELYLQYLV